ncbi:O-unit flippase [Cytophagales bacterium WSM2-2]|nr:O-unit flippase [Cytophagales bacterium WSM2-2]
MDFAAGRFRKYAENAIWLIFEKGFSLFVGLVVAISVARYLKPESYGLLNYSLSFVSIFSAFSTLGIDQIIIRELSKDPAKQADLLGTGFVIKVAGSIFMIVPMMAVMAFMGHDAFTNTLIMIIAIAEIFKGFEVINYFFQSQVMSKFVVQVQLVINFVISLAKIGMVSIHAPLIWFAIIVILGSILNAAGFIYAYRTREGTPWNWKFKNTLALELLRESWPLALYGVALNIQARIDQVMLGNMMNNYEVGQYSVALKFIEIFGFVPVILMNTFMPAVAKAKVAGSDLYHNRLTNLYRLMFLAFVVVGVPIYFFSKDVIVLLYGREFEAAGYLLSLFSLRLFFSNMGVGKSVFIVNESLFKYSLLTVVIGAVANISLNYFMIPLYGPYGAIVASMLSFTVSIFLLDAFFEKTRLNQKLMLHGIFSFWKLNDVA